MTTTPALRSARVGLALAILLTIGVLAGCNSNSKSPDDQAAKTDTSKAKAAASLALSALTTAAPDGKVIVGQLVAPIAATATPMWEFLVGSPKNSKVYAVLVTGGKAQFKEYGKVSLEATQWAEIPNVKAWKIDSDVARDKALAVYPQGKDDRYNQGFITYVADPDREGAPKAMTWNITFISTSKNKGKSEVSSNTVLVDMVSGAAALVEPTKK